MIPTACRRNAHGLRDCLPPATPKPKSPAPPVARQNVTRPGCRERFRALAHEAVVTEDGPRPLRELGTVTLRCEPRSRRPCHPRAVSSGHERSPAVSYGHFEEAVGLGALP
jgi:hypothetical protein